MIQANQLRIGNSVELRGKVRNINESLLYNLQPYYSKPIPITEEILFRCGFELHEDLGDQKYFQMKGETMGYGICFDHNDICFYRFHVINGDTNVTILIHDDSIFQSLHQLQNLYFALTGQELIYKQ